MLGILIWRIWRVERESERHFSLRGGSDVRQPSHLRKIIRVIAESGTAYTTMVLITFFVAISKSNALYPTSDMVSNKNRFANAYVAKITWTLCQTLITTGIAFNVIIIRSTARRDQQFSQFDSGTMASRSGTDPTVRSTTFGSITFNPTPNHMIKVERDIELATMQTDHSAENSPSRQEKYPGSITVSQSVIKAWWGMVHNVVVILLDLCHIIITVKIRSVHK
jgi:hypothetical protein